MRAVQDVAAEHQRIARLQHRSPEFLRQEADAHTLICEFRGREQAGQPSRDQFESRGSITARRKCDPAGDHIQDCGGREISVRVGEKIEPERPILMPAMRRVPSRVMGGRELTPHPALIQITRQLGAKSGPEEFCSRTRGDRGEHPTDSFLPQHGSDRHRGRRGDEPFSRGNLSVDCRCVPAPLGGLKDEAGFSDTLHQMVQQRGGEDRANELGTGRDLEGTSAVSGTTPVIFFGSLVSQQAFF